MTPGAEYEVTVKGQMEVGICGRFHKMQDRGRGGLQRFSDAV